MPANPEPSTLAAAGGPHSWDLVGGDVAGTFAGLFDRYARGLHRYLASRVGPQVADDLVSETFVAALHHRTSFDPARGTPQAWLFGISTNLLRSHRRSETRHLAATSRHLGQADPRAASDEGVEQRIDAVAAVRRLVPDLLRLADVDRDILLLNAWAGLTPAEIATALDLPAGTVRSRLHRLRRNLRAAAPDPAEPVAPVGGRRARLAPAPATSGDLT